MPPSMKVEVGGFFPNELQLQCSAIDEPLGIFFERLDVQRIFVLHIVSLCASAYEIEVVMSSFRNIQGVRKSEKRPSN